MSLRCRTYLSEAKSFKWKEKEYYPGMIRYSSLHKGKPIRLTRGAEKGWRVQVGATFIAMNTHIKDSDIVGAKKWAEGEAIKELGK